MRPGLPVGQTTPNASDRAACDRALRLAAEHGAIEVAAFYTILSARQRVMVFAMLAKVAARALSPESATIREDDDNPQWWTDAELREAHRLWARGHRDKWIQDGQRIYKARHQERRRDAETPEAREERLAGQRVITARNKAERKETR